MHVVRLRLVMVVGRTRVSRLLHVLNAPLNRAIHLLLDLVKCCASVQSGLQNLVCLQEALQLVGKLEVLLCDHVHVSG